MSVTPNKMSYEERERGILCGNVQNVEKNSRTQIKVIFVGRNRKLFSFFTAVIYGFTLDQMLRAVSNLPCGGIMWRSALYIAGMLLCAMGVSLFFHTYISPEVYELFVKEISVKHNIRVDRVKTIYDCISCLIAIFLSFIFFGFGHFEGVKLGTILCSLLNGWPIGCISKKMRNVFLFKDAFQLRDKFNK